MVKHYIIVEKGGKKSWHVKASSGNKAAGTWWEQHQMELELVIELSMQNDRILSQDPISSAWRQDTYHQKFGPQLQSTFLKYDDSIFGVAQNYSIDGNTLTFD